MGRTALRTVPAADNAKHRSCGQLVSSWSKAAGPSWERSADTGFAMAYRKLGVEYGNRGLPEKAGDYYDKAYAHVDRLSDAERYLMLGSYYQLGRHQDAAKSMASYERLLELQPNNTAGLNNLSSQLLFLHQYARAERMFVEALRGEPSDGELWLGLAATYAALGDPVRQIGTLEQAIRTLPGRRDLKLQLDVHAAERPDSACEIVIVESEGGSAGLIVDGVRNAAMRTTRPTWRARR